MTTEEEQKEPTPEQSRATPAISPPEPPAAPAPRFLEQLKDHKVLQWAIAYLGAALGVAQAYELAADAFDWPKVATRIVILALVVGFPIAVTVAWYHGHRALRRVSVGELSIVAVLLLVAGLAFTAVFRQDEAATPAASAATGSAPPSAAIGSAGPNGVAVSPSPSAAPARADGAVAAKAEPLPNKIAVLPCENQSPDPADAYFASGLHQDIIWQLDKIRDLNTIPRLTVLRYANTDLPIATIAAELSVRALLDCTVRYANNRVRITAELVDSTGLRTLWQDDYEPSLADIKDVFAVQADIAMNIANALSVVFTPAERALLEKPPTVSTEAYVLFLKGYDEGDYAKTIELFEQAVAADDSFAAPKAALAFLWASELINTNYTSAISPEERGEHTAKLRKYAERALELDPTVPLARSALTIAAMLNWQWTEAYERMARARELAPNDVTQYDIFLLSYLGRYDEALSVVRRGEQIYPNDPNNAIWRGWAFGLSGRYDEAAVAFAQAIAGTPGEQSLMPRDWLAHMEIARGNGAAALEQLRVSENMTAGQRPAVFLPMWAYAYGRLGQAEDARRIFAEMEQREAAGTRFGAGGWAMANLAVGDLRRAAAWLEAAAKKAAARELDEGFFNLMALRANVTNDDALRSRELADVLSRIHGD